MSYDQILLPSGVARTPAEVDAYLTAQEGQPEAGVVAEIAAELERRDGELPEADSFLSSTPLGGKDNGATLVVSTPYDAIGHVRALLFELATPRGYAVYDPQLTWLADPAGHIPATVTHGGAGEFPYVTKELLDLWLPALADPGPYLIVERGDQRYVQTYRHPDGRYTLEYRDGSPDRHFATSVDDAAAVADLIWAWTTEDRADFDALDWERLEL
ncbi:hypothetical protein [Nocardia otitidiscaviarum]|uniref:Uncharacterized protein n=1 Tax=Nocardia otitidiscaviarum TaxID=1823 RepID=A0A516NTW3_9NOCA|nr:hypothetical protein [Nocardia otitidiscaviarum]MBF6178990.1 hypothetical protein [Nocardia otitidiscaviarum]MCP9621701.1 hypothetical protein [Nocardia otitidiscaviarum]QDP82356.1 hypothetical protein FOH10_30105 [Nocardia otitidiscaviarum]